MIHELPPFRPGQLRIMTRRSPQGQLLVWIWSVHPVEVQVGADPWSHALICVVGDRGESPRWRTYDLDEHAAWERAMVTKGWGDLNVVETSDS